MAYSNIFYISTLTPLYQYLWSFTLWLEPLLSHYYYLAYTPNTLLLSPPPFPSTLFLPFLPSLPYPDNKIQNTNTNTT